MEAVADQPAHLLMLAGLVRAYGSAKCDGSDTRLMKWIAAFGAISARDITPEQCDLQARS